MGEHPPSGSPSQRLSPRGPVARRGRETGCAPGCFYCTEKGQENGPTRIRGQETAAPEPRRTGDHSTGTHSTMGQHLRRVRHGKRFIAQRTAASSGCGHRASKQAAWERKPSVRERREDPAFQQLWKQRAVDRDTCTRPDLSQLQRAHNCPGQQWKMRTALLNTPVQLQREEVPVDGNSSETQEVMPPASLRKAPLHSLVGQWPRMAPCPKPDSFWEFVLSPATPTLNAIGFNFSCDTSSHLDNLSSHTLCS